MAPKKLTTERVKKTIAGKGSSTTPPVDFEFDEHHFHSEEHQRCFELIKDWSFLKERRVQLAKGKYLEFTIEITRETGDNLGNPCPNMTLKLS